MAKSVSFLGHGWKFPFEIGPVEGVKASRGTVAASDIELINNSLTQILGTRFGERFFRRRFGSDIQSLLFQPNVPTQLASMLNFFVLQSIRQFEPRIEISDIQIEVDPNQPDVALISIDFVIIGSNKPGNFVYPFYLQGTPRESVQALSSQVINSG